MSLTQERITLALAPRPVQFYESVGSTNDAARDWLHNDAPHGAVVIADEQTAGRGRMGRTWHTPPGVALALSVILKIPPQHAAQVNMVGTLAVASTLLALKIDDIAIKWANDVLVGGKKISGILPEAVWQGDQLLGVVLGVGVNVRNDFAGTPLAATATTIEAVTERPQDRAALVAVLLLQLDRWLEGMGSAHLLHAYKGAMPMLGEPITVQGGAGTIQGVAQDVRADGALLIQQAGGETVPVLAGDVTVVEQGA